MQRALYVLLGVLLVPTVGLVGDIVTDGKFKSTMSTGAPLEVASDDMVVNLNADMVDGVEGTDIYTKAEVDALVAAAAANSRRWFYVTTTLHAGDEVEWACETGFHMASMWEILDLSNFTYDLVRGKTNDDSGSGPPAWVTGWIRTGRSSYSDPTIGPPNCEAWTSSESVHYGMVAFLDSNWDIAATVISPWVASYLSCNESWPVWCVED